MALYKIILFLYISCINVIFPTAADNGPFLFVEVGTIGNKTFYAELLSLSDWAASYRYCAEKGMMLSTIETQEERDLINSVFTEYGIPKWSTLPEASKYESEFYVSGTDFGSPGKYYWMENGNNLTESTVIGKIVCGTSPAYRCTCCCECCPCNPTYGSCQCYASNCSCSTTCTGDCVIAVHDTRTILRTVPCSKKVKLICHKYNSTR